MQSSKLAIAGIRLRPSLLSPSSLANSQLTVFFSEYNKFADNIKLMLGQPPNVYWKFCWMYVSPAIIVVSQTSQQNMCVCA